LNFVAVRPWSAIAAALTVSTLVAVLPVVASASAARAPIVVVPGKSIGGVRLGDSLAAVRRLLGAESFRAPSYSGYQELVFRERQALNVRFRGGKVIAISASAPGSQTTEGLAMGQPSARITKLYGSLPKINCDVATLFVMRGKTASTYIGVHGGRVVGVDLALPTEEPCGL
jgi:hypothetical protein